MAGNACCMSAARYFVNVVLDVTPITLFAVSCGVTCARLDSPTTLACRNCTSCPRLWGSVDMSLH